MKVGDLVRCTAPTGHEKGTGIIVRFETNTIVATQRGVPVVLINGKEFFVVCAALEVLSESR